MNKQNGCEGCEYLQRTTYYAECKKLNRLVDYWEWKDKRPDECPKFDDTEESD